LQGIISITPMLLRVDGAGVELGWSFSVGIVNLILIIAFVVIALAVIMGSEKIAVKKALPKLILVALLVNFTLFFVGVGIDISNILFNSIAAQFLTGQGGANILHGSITGLLEFGNAQILQTKIFIGVLVSKSLIPYGNVIAMVGTIIGFSGIMGVIIQFFFYGGMMLILSGLFFLFFLVFLIRVFVIQVLAVLAPLAFFCLIFDQTEKYWKQWIEAFLEWLLVGIIFIFLMYIGLLMAPVVTQVAQENIGGFGRGNPIAWWFDGVGNIIGSIFLLVYFVVIVGVAKNFVPKAVGAVISQVGAVAKMATPFAGAIAKGAIKKYRGETAKREEEIKEREKETGSGLRQRASKSWAGVLRAQNWALRSAHRVAGQDMNRETERDVEENTEDLKKKYGENYEGMAKDIKSPVTKRIMTDSQKIAALQYLEGGGAKALKNLSEEELFELLKVARDRGDSKTVKNIIKHLPTLADPTYVDEKDADEETKKERRERAEVIQSMLGLDKPKELESLEKELKSLEGSIEELTQVQKERRDELKESIKREQSKQSMGVYKMAAQRIKTKDVENLSTETVMNENFLKAVCLNRDLSFVRALGGRSDGGQIMEQLKKAIGEIDLKENPALYSSLKRSPLGEALGVAREAGNKERTSNKAPRRRIEVSKKNDGEAES